MPTSRIRAALIALGILSFAAAPSAMTSTPNCTPQPDIHKLQAAAAEGDTDAMVKLGCSYNLGSGVSKDRSMAALWFSKAADGGSTSGMVHLGMLHENVGSGVPHDESQAAAWYRKAADLGDASAMYRLGILYWAGRGVPQDCVEAHKWLSLAAAHDAGEAKKRSADARDSVAKKMPPHLIADALKRQQDWQAAFETRKK
jgi:TPR repeat protein